MVGQTIKKIVRSWFGCGIWQVWLTPPPLAPYLVYIGWSAAGRQQARGGAELECGRAVASSRWRAERERRYGRRRRGLILVKRTAAPCGRPSFRLRPPRETTTPSSPRTKPEVWSSPSWRRPDLDLPAFRLFNMITARTGQRASHASCTALSFSRAAPAAQQSPPPA